MSVSMCVAVKYSGESVHLSGHPLPILCFYALLLCSLITILLGEFKGRLT